MAKVIADALIDAIRSGDEALDRGVRGPAPELDLLRSAGLLTAPLPVGDGGQGWGTCANGAGPMLALLSALGGASLPIARIYEGHVNAIQLVARFASADQRAGVAEAVRGGALMGVWGADGTRPVSVETSGGVSRLSGEKAFASGLGDVSLAIVIAATSDGAQMVMVDASDEARSNHDEWDVDGMIGSRSGRFDCDGLPAGQEHLLGKPADLFVEPDFHGGLWRLAACYAGAVHRIARLLAQVIQQRGFAASPLMQHRLGLIAVDAEGARLWAAAACLSVEDGEDDPQRAVRTALFAREAVEQSCVRVLEIAERIAGTAMHRRSSDLGRLCRDLRLYLRQANLDGKLALAVGMWIGKYDPGYGY